MLLLPPFATPIRRTLRHLKLGNPDIQSTASILIL
eukprot:XP_001706665.1 Hypothetical protein GL50803_99516 [Giardia lamblia ATCC 50803]